MSYGGVYGVNAQGHKGWTTVRCAIHARYVDVSKEPVYKCPKCTPKYNVYFCADEYKELGGKCPYCHSKLVPVITPES